MWNKALDSIKNLYKIIMYEWLVDNLAFVFIPVVIYSIVFIVLQRNFLDLLKLPEWMFISMILYGTAIKDFQVSSQRNSMHDRWLIRDFTSGGFFTFPIALCVFGITLSAVLLTFIVIAQYSENLVLLERIYTFQSSVFSISMVVSIAARMAAHEHREYVTKERIQYIKQLRNERDQLLDAMMQTASKIQEQTEIIDNLADKKTNEKTEQQHTLKQPRNQSHGHPDHQTEEKGPLD